MKKLLALLLVLVMMVGLVACSNNDSKETEAPEKEEVKTEAQQEEKTDAPAEPEAKKTIYVLAPNPDHGWTGAVGVFAQEKVDELNAEGKYNMVLQTFATADDQIKQIEDIIANNPGDGSVGVVMLPQGEAVENAIQQLVDNNIPYSAVDRIIASVKDTAVSNVKYDNVEFGAAAAYYLVSHGMKEGDKVVVVEGDDSSAGTDRTDGFNKFLKGEIEYRGEKIAEPWTSLDAVSYSGATNWNRAVAQTYFETYLSNPENAQTRYVVTWDDELAIGVFDALEGSAIDASVKEEFLAGKPYITGGGGPQIMYDIIGGKNTDYSCVKSFSGIMSVTYPPAMIQVAIQDMIDHFEGKEVIQENTQSAECVDASNVDNYVGFY